MSTSTTEDKRDRKKKVLPIVFASIAVVGVGAALTSAAWTDDLTFSATGSAKTFDLQGSTNGGTSWGDIKPDSEGTAITFTDTKLSNLSPGDTFTLNFKVKNFGTGDGHISAVTTTPSGVDRKSVV